MISELFLIGLFCRVFLNWMCNLLKIQMIHKEGVPIWNKGRSLDWLLFLVEVQSLKHRPQSPQIHFKKLRCVLCLFFPKNIKKNYMISECMKQATNLKGNLLHISGIVVTGWKIKARRCPLQFKWSTRRTEGYGHWHGIWNWKVGFLLMFSTGSLVFFWLCNYIRK